MSKQPLLTIGMAHFDDFSGLFPTIQSIRMNNASLMPHVEFIVVNNNPEDGKTADAIKGLLASTVECAGHKYIELPNAKGTSVSREQIFRHASGKYTAAMDCHLEFWPGSFAALLKFYDENPGSKDIVSGPLIMDSLRNFATHFRDEWDDGMWGKWSQAWQCQCGPEGQRFDITSRDGKTFPILLQLGNIPAEKCNKCGKGIPSGAAWAQHEQYYVERGFDRIGFMKEPAFEVPGQGLGFFSCRTEIWPGFNPHALGFGGEELYIQEKFRQRGGRAMCIPGIKWNHRFYRTGGAKYPNTNYLKARNYILEFNELGMDLEPVRKHFTEDAVKADLAKDPPEYRTFLTPEMWEYIVADPVGRRSDPGPQIQAIRNARTALPEIETIEQLFDKVKVINRDLNEHMPEFSRLASLAKSTVVEFTARRESTIAFLHGKPQSLVSFSTEVETYCHKAAYLAAMSTTFEPRDYKMGEVLGQIPENELLFIDTLHRYAQLQMELKVYSPFCRRFIAIHDTEIYGARGDDNGIGVIQAIAEFCDENPQWAVISHAKNQYGLTVLSCQIEDRPENPVEGFNIPRGPGTELKKILHSLNIHPSPDCSCNSKAAQMDIWGINACENEHFETIVEWLRKGTWSGLDLASAVARSFFNGIAWEINPLKPFDSLARLCIRRAKETEAKRLAAEQGKIKNLK